MIFVVFVVLLGLVEGLTVKPSIDITPSARVNWKTAVTIKCSYVENPLFEPDFMKDDLALLNQRSPYYESAIDNNDDKVTITNDMENGTSALVISNLTATDGGDFYCAVIRHGISDAATLTVIEPPESTVSDIVVSADYTSASVSFSGAEEASVYQCEYKTPNEDSWTATYASDMTCTLVDLAPGTTYTVRVLAGNEAGYRENTDVEESTFTTKDNRAPVKLSDLSVTAAENNSALLNISWELGRNSELDITVTDVELRMITSLPYSLHDHLFTIPGNITSFQVEANMTVPGLDYYIITLVPFNSFTVEEYPTAIVYQLRQPATEPPVLPTTKSPTEPPKQTTEAPKQTTEAPKQTTEAPKRTTEAPKNTTKSPTEPPKQTTKAPAPQNTEEVAILTTEEAAVILTTEQTEIDTEPVVDPFRFETDPNGASTYPNNIRTTHIPEEYNPTSKGEMERGNIGGKHYELIWEQDRRSWAVLVSYKERSSTSWRSGWLCDDGFTDSTATQLCYRIKGYRYGKRAPSGPLLDSDPFLATNLNCNFEGMCRDETFSNEEEGTTGESAAVGGSPPACDRETEGAFVYCYNSFLEYEVKVRSMYNTLKVRQYDQTLKGGKLTLEINVKHVKEGELSRVQGDAAKDKISVTVCDDVPLSKMKVKGRDGRYKVTGKARKGRSCSNGVSCVRIRIGDVLVHKEGCEAWT